jgi:hypothetical protein
MEPWHLTQFLEVPQSYDRIPKINDRDLHQILHSFQPTECLEWIRDMHIIMNAANVNLQSTYDLSLSQNPNVAGFILS